MKLKVHSEIPDSIGDIKETNSAKGLTFKIATYSDAADMAALPSNSRARLRVSTVEKVNKTNGRKEALEDIKARPYGELREIARSLDEELKVVPEHARTDEELHSNIKTQARLDELRRYLVGDIELEKERAKVYEEPTQVVKSEQKTPRKWWKMPAIALGTVGAAVVGWFGFKGVDEAKTEAVKEPQTMVDNAPHEELAKLEIKSAEAPYSVRAGKESSAESTSYSVKAGDTVDRILRDLIAALDHPVSDKLLLKAYHQILKDNNLQERVVGNKTMVDIKVGDALSLAGAQIILNEQADNRIDKKIVKSTDEKVSMLNLDESHDELQLKPTATWDTAAPLVETTVLESSDKMPEVRDIQRVEGHGGILKLIHRKLRESGLRVTSQRASFLMQLAIDDSIAELRGLAASGKIKKWKYTAIPEGAMIDCSTVDLVVDGWKAERDSTGKSKTVPETVKAMGLIWSGNVEMPEQQ